MVNLQTIQLLLAYNKIMTSELRLVSLNQVGATMGEGAIGQCMWVVWVCLMSLMCLMGSWHSM